MYICAGDMNIWTAAGIRDMMYSRGLFCRYIVHVNTYYYHITTTWSSIQLRVHQPDAYLPKDGRSGSRWNLILYLIFL
jgi:hypothetical protein